MIAKVIFVHGDNFTANVIQTITHGQYCHVGIEILGGIVEAIVPKVVLSLTDKYANYITKYVDVDIPDMVAAESEAKALIGKPYGFVDCITGGLHDLAGKNIIGDGYITADCSETVTRILRAGGIDILPGVPADDVTPEDLLKALT